MPDRSKFIITIFLLLLLSSCSEDPFPRCVGADDFSNPKVTLSANRPKGHTDFADSQGLNNTGLIANPDQVIKWKRTGFITNGRPIIIKTYGQWTSWLDNKGTMESTQGMIEGDSKSNFDKSINSADISKTRICSPYGKHSPTLKCKSDTYCPYIDNDTAVEDKSNTGADQQYGPPCWLEKGYGAYILLKRPDDPDPNKSIDIMRSPVSPVMHLGSDSESFVSSEREIIDSNCNTVNLEPGFEIYVKILDRFYFDNAGGYSISFLQGVHSPTRKVFESVRREVEGILMKNTKAMFMSITKNNNFIDFVKVLLVIHIAILGISFILGTVKQPASEIFVRIIKISLVMQLISPNSWNFFYNNFFILFTEGLHGIIAIINSHSGAEYRPDEPFYFLDYIISEKIFSATVWKVKIKAMMVGSMEGFFYTIIFIAIAVIFVFFVCYAFVIYITAFIGISLLIVLMPIFFLGLLFSFLKQAFESWGTQVASFMLQSVMMFALLSLFSSLILNSYYRTLGFSACYNDILTLSLTIKGQKIFHLFTTRGWTPGQEFKVIKLDAGEPDIGITRRYTFTGGKKIILIPPEYKRKGCRYVDFPYLDPGYKDSDCDKIDKDIDVGIKIDCTKDKNKNEIECKNVDCTDLTNKSKAECKNIDCTDDQNKGKNECQFTKGEGYDYEKIKDHVMTGHLIIFDEIFVTLLIVIIIYHLRVFVQKLGASIAGASPFTTVIGVAYEMQGSFFRFANDMAAGIRMQVFKKVGDKLDHGISKVTSRPGIADNAVLKGIRSVSNTVGKVSSAASWILSTESDLTRYYRQKDAFKELDYAKAMIGSHLPTASSALKATKMVATHILDKSILGIKSDTLIDSIKNTHANRMEKLRSSILGYRPPAAPMAEDKDDEADREKNPFQSRGSINNINGLRDLLEDHEKLARIDKDGALRETLERNIEILAQLQNDEYNIPIVDNEEQAQAVLDIRNSFSTIADATEGVSFDEYITTLDKSLANSENPEMYAEILNEEMRDTYTFVADNDGNIDLTDPAIQHIVEEGREQLQAKADTLLEIHDNISKTSDNHVALQHELANHIESLNKIINPGEDANIQIPEEYMGRGEVGHNPMFENNQ